MPALARNHITDSFTRAANDDCINGGPCTRTKYSYDAAGHTTGYGTNSFTYNDRGRVASTSASSTDYLYNALGQMIEKSGTGGTTMFMQDESGHLLGEYSGSGSLIEETLWLGDIPVATLQPNGSGGVNIYYVHSDHLNAPRKVAQPTTGTLAWRWDTDPFGTAAPNQNPAGLGTFPYNLRFPGQYYQAETGLNQNWNRDYDPVVDRYLESDPAGLDADGYSTYVYVAGDPIDYDDPDGLYRMKNSDVPMPSPALDSLLHCMETILGIQLTVTSTTDGKHQDPGHYAGTSIDIRPPATAQVEDVFCAAGNCGAAWGLNESKGAQQFKYTNGPNLHLQLKPPHHPRPTAPNAIPVRCKPGVCSK